jgi:hypothetical protein
MDVPVDKPVNGTVNLTRDGLTAVFTPSPGLNYSTKYDAGRSYGQPYR